MNAALALQQAMRAALLADSALTTLLGGAHVFDEVPRGEQVLHVSFGAIETRDWSVMDQKAHEHFVSIDVATNARSRGLAQSICDRIEAVLDNAALSLSDHRLVNLRAVFWNVSRLKNTNDFGATLRFRAATEPL
jgi:Protein of unknown function (DUF3168)